MIIWGLIVKWRLFDWGFSVCSGLGAISEARV